VFVAVGDLEHARTHYEQALHLVREIDSPINEAEALEGLGEVWLQQGRIDDGAEQLRQALAIYRRLDVPGGRRIEARLAALR
jgi:tetratricopeptide (TPR) repeat protein